MFPSSRLIRWAAVAVVLTAASLLPFLALRLQEGPLEDSLSAPLGIRLHLTAEASRALQGSTPAFPSTDAGFSAYYRVPQTGGGFGLDKVAVDRELLEDAGPTARRVSTATLLQMGSNYTIVAVPVINIDGLTTKVHLYYDDQGWLVAYFPEGKASSQAWQARGVNAENPVLADVSLTTLLDAINDALVTALAAPPLKPEQVGYYHWRHPMATNFLMFGIAQSTKGSKSVAFAVPPSFTVHEVSASMWVSLDPLNQGPCAKATLDGADLFGQQCTRSFTHHVVDLASFSSNTAHTLTLEQTGQDAGASGALGMLIYTAP